MFGGEVFRDCIQLATFWGVWLTSEHQASSGVWLKLALSLLSLV